MNAKIIVCCHKRDVMETEEPYFPIHVGKASSSSDLGITGDDTGENISVKNFCYCELTGMYWAWKNLTDVDIVGLCHYRRYFDFHRQCRWWAPFTAFRTADFDRKDRGIPDNILYKVNNGDVVVTKRTNCQFNLMADYCCNHNSDDFRILQQIIMTTQPECIKRAFYNVMYASNRKYTYNMFVMRWTDFDEYCQWLFPLLEAVEAAIDITHYNDVQKRIFGYMGERLLNVWLLAYGKRLILRPVMWFTDQYDAMSGYTFLKYKARCLMNDLSRILGQPKYKSVCNK